jgi:hypothetical protein
MYPEDSLTQLFTRRWHGAVNINGIDFQILYSLYCSLDLLSPNPEFEILTLEGIEDIDLKPFKTDNVYVQVKTSTSPWYLNQLASPLLNFIQLNSVTSKPQNFKLIVNFEIIESISKLFVLNDLENVEKQKLLKNLLKAKEFKNNINVTDSQVVEVLSKSKIESISRQDVITGIKQKLVIFLNITPDLADLLLLAFSYQFIEWATERKTITKLDLTTLYVNFQEKTQRNLEFEAYSKSWINKINWNEDNQPNDYFEGKKTRLGHIALSLDVKRQKWLDEIQSVFEKTNVCIIKEASGQGKSTLAFRFAHDYWIVDNIYKVNVVESPEQAEQISNYFKTVTELGLPIYVLIDDINSERKYFSTILENCASHKIPFLITTRNDDFYQFTKSSLFTAEFIIPAFDINEAKLIYQNLDKEQKLHQNVISAEWAFELISSPKSLIEYIYLLTKGQMLQERLADQVKLMREQGKSTKIDFLRKVILADVCRTPLNINQIILKNQDNITDYQQIIGELQGEFIDLEENLLKGYHWVRSNHLINILHNNYANPSVTSIQLINWLKNEQIETFIGNLSEIENIDFNLLIEGLSCNDNLRNLENQISIIRGIFKFGEVTFFLNNKNIFDEAFTEFSSGALFLLHNTCIATQKLDVFQFFGFEENENFLALGQISKKLNHTVRGFLLVKDFMTKMNLNFTKTLINNRLKLIGEYLDWSYWVSDINLSLSNVLSSILENTHIFNLETTDFSMISQGVYRKFPNEHKVWFKRYESKIIKKLETELECSIRISNNEVFMKYSKFNDKMESLNDATMRRLDIIRSAIPFCQKYNGGHSSTAIISSLLKLGYKYAYDESEKEILVENLHLKSDVSKNRILGDILDEKYRVKTWFEFHKAYYFLRISLVDYLNELSKRLRGLKHDFKENDASSISNKILRSYKKMPYDIQDDELNKQFEISTDCFNSFNNFLILKAKFISNENGEDAKRLVFINFNNFLLELPNMQKFFTLLQLSSPNYFDFSSLDETENQLFNSFKLLLCSNIPSSQAYWELNTVAYK